MILATSPSDVSALLKASPLMEAEKQAHKKTYLKLSTAQKIIERLIEPIEAKWDRDQELDSEKEAVDYLDAAEFLRDHFKRRNNRIEKIQRWLDEQPIPENF